MRDFLTMLGWCLLACVMAPVILFGLIVFVAQVLVPLLY